MKVVEGWMAASLGELLVTRNNKTKQIKSTEYSAVGSFPVVDQSAEFICGYHDNSAKLIDTDLPLTIFGDHTRHTKFVDFPFIAGADGTQLLKPKHGIQDKFFYYLVASAADKIGNFGYDRHFKHLKEYVCAYPLDESEQAKIAEILSTVDRAIEQTEALIAKQQHIKTGLMQNLLTRGIDEHGNLRTEQTHKFKDSPLGRIPVEWEVVPVEQKLACIIDYRGRTPLKEDSGIPLITAKNVREGFLNEEPREFIAEENYEAWMTRGIPTPGDVMFTTEAPMGNVARVPEYKIALAQRLITLPTRDTELSGTFLFWLLRWARTTERLELLTSGSTVVGVKQSVFRKVLFPFPQKDEQESLTKVLEAHNAIASNEKAKLQKLRSLKTALMQDLLTGKKRVTAMLNKKETACI